ncbi:MAG: hypothetical protein P4L27_00135 [Ignavibacteriaceae bacterium]|nr:hypothetical protein [Ignavibacteriaceae bacterium]
MNNNRGIFLDLYELCSQATSSRLIAGQDIELVYEEGINYKKILNKLQISFETVGPNSIRLNLLNLPFPVFYDKEHFLSQISLDNFNKDLGILQYKNNEFMFFNHSERISYGKNGIMQGNNFITNTFSYIRIKKLLSSDIFSDYQSESNREIVIISATKGKILLGYPLIKDDFDFDINIEDNEKKLEDKLALKEFTKFLKNDLYEFLFEIPKENRLKYLIENLDIIIESANRNYEIYLSSFSFDQIRDEFDKRKQKYIDELREIINKISGYSIGLPISISAASFAAFKSLDSLPTFILIIITFIVYSIYFIFMIRHNRDDLENIQKDYDMDFELLFEKEFFIRNPKEKKSFTDLKTLLNGRLENLLIKINILFSIVLILNTSFIVIILIQANISMFTTIITALVIIIMFFCVYLFKPKEKAE